MKILTLSILSLATVSVTAGAQDSAPPAPSTVQADKQFLQQLERRDPAPVAATPPAVATPSAVAPSAVAPTAEKEAKPAPVAKQTAPARQSTESAPVKKVARSETASVSSERPQSEVRPVEKKWKKEAATKATVTNEERITPPAGNNGESIETRPVRRANQDRTARTAPLDPFYDSAAHAPISSGAKPTRASRSVVVQPPPEVAVGTPQTVTVTKTITTVPAPAPKEEDDGFFHRLFRHKDRSDGE